MVKLKRSGFNPQAVVVLKARVVGEYNMSLGRVNSTHRFNCLQTGVIENV